MPPKMVFVQLVYHGVGITDRKDHQSRDRAQSSGQKSARASRPRRVALHQLGPVDGAAVDGVRPDRHLLGMGEHLDHVVARPAQ